MGGWVAAARKVEGGAQQAVVVTEVVQVAAWEGVETGP